MPGRRAIFVRPARPDDVARLELRPESRAEGAQMAAAFAADPAGATFAAVRFPDEIVAIGGGIAGAGGWQVWALFAEVPRGDWPLLMDCARAALARLAAEHGARRFTALARSDAAGARAVLERLGFTRSAATTRWPGMTVMAREARA